MRRRFRFRRRRRVKVAHLAALIALAVVVGLLSRGGWLYKLRQRWTDPFPPKISGLARLIDGDAKAVRRGVWDSEFQVPRRWRDEHKQPR